MRATATNLSTPDVSTPEAGQATAEYALVMLVAAGIAGAALAWAVGGGGVERLLDAVVDSIVGDVG